MPNDDPIWNKRLLTDHLLFSKSR